MKKILIFCLISVITSCSKDDEQECLEIEKQYLEALGYTGGNQAAINQVKSQYEAKKAKAGCN